MGRSDPKVWEAILAHLRQSSPGMCRRWFDDLQPVDLSGGTLHVLVREPVQLKYLRQRCQRAFSEAAQAVLKLLVAVKFIGEEDLEHSPPAFHSAPRRPSFTLNGLDDADDHTLISPDHSFENFVMGPSNRLAHAAALAVADRGGGNTYNPFFVHGGVGLGKTHLLQAICQGLQRKHPDLEPFYITCNGFINLFCQAMQSGQMSAFRRRIRNAEILLIDDIHDLANRDGTREEFFHTFNNILQTGKQVVLSSTAAPNEIPGMEERLTSRFSSGLVAQIEKPDFETRVRILNSKAALRQISLPEDVASYIANKIDTNIRELEGAITKIQTLAVLTGELLNLELARKAVGDIVTVNSEHIPTIQEIVDTVTSYYGVRLSDLLSKRRHKSISLPRQVCMWLARRHTRHSLKEIGGYFGGRDHTTVMHAVKAIEKKRASNATTDTDVSVLDERVCATNGHG